MSARPKCTFDDKYTFRWMTEPRLDDHPSLESLLHDSPYRNLQPAIAPDFMSFRQPEPIARAEMRQLGCWVPPWYWQRMQHCTCCLSSLFNRLWPPLTGILPHLPHFEWLSHVTPGDEKYRDHLFHAFKVACVGTWLLSRETSTGTLGADIMGLQFATPQRSHWQRWFQRGTANRLFSDQDRVAITYWAFLLAAIFHDFGYAYGLRCRMDDKVGGLFRWMAALSQNTEPTTEMQRTLENSLAMEYVWEHGACDNARREERPGARRKTGFARDTLTLNHSTASCLFILHLRDELKRARTLTPGLDLAFEIAAEAAMLHDMVKEKNWCGLRDAPGSEHFLKPAEAQGEVPVAVLLMFCDEIACWSRPNLSRSADMRGMHGVKLRLDEKCIKERVTLRWGADLRISGTPKVVKDIQDKLELVPHPAIGQSLFGMRLVYADP